MPLYSREMPRHPLEKVYDQFAAPLFRFLAGMMGSREDAADALQDLFLRLTQRGLNGIDDLQAYLWAAARNAARAVRPRRPTPFLSTRNGAPADPHAREQVEAALSSLPPEQREIVILHVLEGLTLKEAAEFLSIPTDTAASRFRYAREKLRDIL